MSETLKPQLAQGGRGETAAPGAEKQIYMARALRDFGDGFAVLLVPFYLAAHGLGALEIGIVATLGLLGSALTTLAIGMISHRYGERALLIAASALMAATGADAPRQLD